MHGTVTRVACAQELQVPAEATVLLATNGK